jgi:hypothetical protein
MITELLGLVVIVMLARRLAGFAVRLWSEPRLCGAALPEHARPVMRQFISGMADSAKTLTLRSAPGLSSASDRRHRVERPEFSRIESLVRQLGASAVAVSGPRGAGKSTLLRDFMERDGAPFDLVVHVEASSAYAARDFTILLYKELCQTVLDQIRRDRRQWLRNARPPRLRRSLAAAVMRRRAETERNRLRFLQNVSQELNGAIQFRGGLSFGLRRTRQLIEQPVSLPDLVRSFRQFALEVLQWWSGNQPDSGQLVIIIDELDRINDGIAAERFINEIKGIFGVPGCTYFVTISEDALAVFERRMVGARPALDSAFDEVLRLDILTLEGSREMLGRRLGGCPRPFMALCHALSGGLPRELIRAARALIDAVNEAETAAGKDADVDCGLAALTARAVAADIDKLKFGFAPRLRGDTPAGSLDNVLMMLADEAWPGVTVKDMLEHGAGLIYRPATEDAAGDRACLQLGVSLWYYATILDTFGDRTGRFDDRLNLAAERLARVRSVMPRSTELALRLLIALRKELGLRVPAPVRRDDRLNMLGAEPRRS